MNRVLALTVLVAVVIGVSSARIAAIGKEDLRVQFAQYVRDFGKTYAVGSQEYELRFSNFVESLRRIRHLNEADQDATYAINKFSDMSKQEFRSLMQNGGTKLPAASLATACLANGVTVPNPNPPVAPDSFDWRAKGMVTPVKDQAQCGSCWAFSTIGNIESMYAIKGNALTNFSEQLIVDCSKACCMVESQSTCNSGCDGGWMWTAMFDVMSWNGVMLETDYPYTGMDGQCKRDPKKTIAKVKNYTCITQPNGAGADEGVMASYLAANGPLSVALDADPLMDYSSGIINPWFPDYECDPTQLDHAVLAVGYGSEDGTPFWIVKNSWGSAWGENGYFRMYRGEGLCGINNAVVSVIM